MITTEEVKKYLEDVPDARERKNKNRAITNIIIKKHMQEMVKDVLTADRAWRKLLQDNESLRGKDYGDKDELELEKQRDLGYNV